MDNLHSSNTYKLQKEAFVSHNNGDTVLDINKICWTAVVGSVCQTSPLV